MFNVEKWMEIAEKYGAILENITFIQDENGFVGAYAVDVNKDVYIEVPFPLLQYVENMVIEESYHGLKNVDQEDIKELYSEIFDFIFSEQRITWLKNLTTEFNAFSEKLKEILKKAGFVIKLFGDKSYKEIKLLLLQARTLNFKNKPIYMPLIEFFNHSLQRGAPFGIKENAVYVKAKPDEKGQVFAIYNMGDDFSFLNTYFFLPSHPFAYSAAMTIDLPDRTKLIIGRNFGKVKSNVNWIRIPEYEVEGNVIRLSHLWIGSTTMPRRPFWSFRELWEKHLKRNNTLNIWSRIRSYNTSLLVRILELLEKEPDTYAKELVKKATLQHLKNIAEAFEEV